MPRQVKLLSSSCSNKFLHPIKMMQRCWIIAKTGRACHTKYSTSLRASTQMTRCCSQTNAIHVNALQSQVFFSLVFENAHHTKTFVHTFMISSINRRVLSFYLSSLLMFHYLRVGTCEEWSLWTVIFGCTRQKLTIV